MPSSGFSSSGVPGSTLAIEKGSVPASYIDAIERVLDKGIVFDAWRRMSVAGIDLISVDAHVIVASIDTYLSRVSMSRVQFIVAAQRLALFETMRVLNSVAGINVVLDRRSQQRRQRVKSPINERRQAERRRRNINPDLESFGLAVI
jgi:hypothetical protein